MAYAKLPNIGRLQRQNSDKIFSIIDKTTVINSAAERGEDLDSDSPIEDILYNWAGDIIKDLNVSWVEHGFNKDSNSGKFEPLVIDKAGLLKVLQLSPANDNNAWQWAETGRRKGKRPPIAPIEEWITYRGINVDTVKGWHGKKKTAKGDFYKPYKNISDRLKLRHIMAEAFSRSIGRHGTIKGDGRKGSKTWTGYKGSKWFSSVVNDKALETLSLQLSEAVGYTISVRIAQSF